MRHHGSWKIKLAGLFAGGAMLYQIGIPGCASIGGWIATNSFNSCWLFDCVNGAGGGAFTFCGNPSTTVDDLLLDCPGQITTGTGTTTGTTTTTTGATGTTTTTGAGSIFGGLGGFGGGVSGG